MMSKQKKLKMFVLSLIVIVVLGIGTVFSFYSRFAMFNGQRYDRNAEFLDFSNQNNLNVDFILKFRSPQEINVRNTNLSVEDYDLLHAELPDCMLLCELPLQNGLMDSGAHDVNISDLNNETLRELGRFPHIETLKVEKCTDYTLLDALKEQHPGCAIDYSVELSGQTYSWDSEEILLENGSVQEIADRLSYLPRLRNLTLTGVLPGVEEIKDLKTKYPAVTVSWKIAFGDDTLNGNIGHITLKEGQDPGILASNAEYFPKLKYINMNDVSASNQAKYQVWQAFPDAEVVWLVDIDGQKFPADAEEIEIDGTMLSGTDPVEEAVPYFQNIQKVVILNSNVPYEDLHQLDLRLGDVRVVWNMDFSGLDIRTDDLYYAPNKYGGDEYNVPNDQMMNLKYCTDMICVDIGHRICCTSIEWAAYMPHLKYLIIADTRIADLTPLEDLKELVFLEIFLTPVRDTSPLLKVKSLEDLNLCCAPADPEPLKQMTWLKRLWWDERRISQEELQAALPNTEVNCMRGGSTARGWRHGKLYYEMRDVLGMFYMDT